MKQLNMLFIVFLFSYHVKAQAPTATTAAGYYFATGINYGLVNMSGGTQVIGPNLENVSTITFELGFNFNFAGTTYTRFSIGSSGIFGLGNTPVSPIYYEPRNSILAPYYVFPLFSPWSDELTSAANGGVSYKLVTNNNIKKLVIEWRLKASSDETTTNYNKIFQAWLLEGSNRIQYVYGNSPVRDENSYIGFAKSNPDYKLVNSTNHTITQNSNNAWPGAGRSYLFSPVEIVAMPLPLMLDEGGNLVNVNCFGAANGSVTLGNISGGDGNYTITWSGPNGFTATGSTINNLVPGVYLFTIGDGSGAEPVSGSRTVGEPAILNATMSTVQACAGNYNGNITVTNAVGGSGNYEYRINNGNWQSSGLFNALGAGVYTLQMRDATAINCVRSLGTATVTDFALSATVSAVAACDGTNNGSISIRNATGGSATYEFRINNGNWQSSNVFSGLAAGVYSVHMRDVNFNSCIKILGDQTITEYILNASVSSAAACAGTNNGSININNATGGTGNYEYNINNGNWQSSNIFSGLAAGVYAVYMRDVNFNSCIKILGDQTITEYTLNALVTSAAACTGTNNGSVSISNATGGSGNYEYRINNGNWQSAGLFTGLIAGVYTVQMRDFNFSSCIKNLNNQTITGYTLNAIAGSTQACAGTSNGSIIISNASGGSGNYEYRINNGNWQSSGLFNGLSAGIYTVQMRDVNVNTCIKNLGDQTITEYILNASVSSAAACAGTNNGSISISNATGGSGNYEYRISNGNWQSAGLFTGLVAGVYTVQMRDFNFSSCIKNLNNQTVTGYTLNAIAGSTQACAGTSNGAVSISNASGGSGNYEYRVNNGIWQSLDLFSGLSAGIYTVQMRDINVLSCIKDLSSQTVTEYSLNGFVSTTPACAGTSNGSISISNTAGGTGNYQYQLNNGNWQTSNLFNGLVAGIYTVQMRDAGNASCIKILGNQTVASFSLNAAVSTVSACPGINNGTINISNATGGSGNYQYQLNSGIWQTAATFTGLFAGTYALQLRDANNTTCIKSLGNFTVAQAQAPVISISSNAPPFCNALYLTASTVNGASYIWSNGQAGNSIILNNSNADGPYTVTVTNTNGCTGSASFQYVKQNILNNYTLVGLKTISLGESNTVNGSVGVTAAAQTTKIAKNSVINGFVKSPVISLSQPVTISQGSIIGVAALTLPTMLFNTAVTSGLPNLTLPDDYSGPAITYNVNQLIIGRRAQVTLTGNVFGKIIIKESADVIFTATDISINDLATENGKALPGGIDYLSIGFSPNTAIRIKNTIALGEKNLVNGFGATFYMGDVNTDAEKITINGKNTTVNANTYMPRGTLSITQSGTDASFTCIMNGTHIDEMITSAKYITWSAIDCNAAPAPLQFMQEQTGTPAEQILSVEQQTLEVETTVTAKPEIAVYPSPTTGKFIMQLNTTAGRAEIVIVNQLGLEIRRESQHNILKGGEFKFDISKYPAGSYYIKVITEKGVYTKQIVKTN